MKRLEHKRKKTETSIMRPVLLWLLLAVFSGCTYKFTMIDEEDGGDDTDPYADTASVFDTDSETETETDTELPPCPAGIEFHSEPAYTELASTKDTTSGTVYPDACGPSGVVIGYQGNLLDHETLTAQGKIQARCGVPTVSHVDGECVVKISDGEILPMRGTSGTTEWQRLCPTDQMVVGFLARTGSNIDSLRLTCAPLVITRDAVGHKISRGDPTHLDPAGGTTGPTEYEDYCADDQVATISSLRASNVLLGFGLGCQAPSPVY